MKKVLLFLAFTFALGMTAQAQCSGSAAAGAPVRACCANKAAKAATGDASIEKRMGDDGTVSYVRKETDGQGTVKFVSVRFDETANAFVNVAPPSAIPAAEKEGFVKKSCSSTAAAKSCCAGASAAGKSCCAKKTASADAAPAQNTEQ